jgi:hypothetical protein
MGEGHGKETVAPDEKQCSSIKYPSKVGLEQCLVVDIFQLEDNGIVGQSRQAKK